MVTDPLAGRDHCGTLEDILYMQHLLSAASCWIPEAIVDSAWIEHAPFAFWLMDAHRPSMLVELGTHYGYSYFAFNQALRNLRVKCRCFAVDTWTGDEHAGYYDDHVFESVRKYNEERFADFSELLRMTFAEALSRFEDGSIDLLHIDGRHFYEDVKHDFETWVPKLSKRAVVLLHDTNVRSHDFGVYRLWEELKPHYPHFEFLNGHGLGVLGVGAEIPSTLCDLFAISENESQAEMVRGIYGRLGGAVTDRALMHKVLDNAAVLQAEPATLASAMSSLETELDRLRQVEGVAKQIHSEAAVVQGESAKLISAMSSLETELDRLRQSETVAREQIVSLTKALNDATAEKAEIAQLNSVLMKELKEAKENVAAMSAQLDRSQLLMRQQTLVVQRTQNELMLQSQNNQLWQKENRELADQLASSRAEAVRYSQILNDVSGLVVPVPIRKLFPTFMRRPIQAFKQRMRTQTHHIS